jgi:hypothetical protein
MTFKIKNPFKYITKHLFSPKSENPERINDDNNESNLKIPHHIKELETQINQISQTNQINQIKEIEVKKMRIIKWEETTAFTPPISGGQVIKVYDGDSITIAGYLPMYNSPLFRFSVRLNGIDTAEIKGKSEDEI